MPKALCISFPIQAARCTHRAGLLGRHLGQKHFLRLRCGYSNPRYRGFPRQAQAAEAFSRQKRSHTTRRGGSNPRRVTPECRPESTSPPRKRRRSILPVGQYEPLAWQHTRLGWPTYATRVGRMRLEACHDLGSPLPPAPATQRARDLTWTHHFHTPCV